MAKYGKKRQRNKIIIITFIIVLVIITGLTYYLQLQKRAADPGYGTIYDISNEQDSILNGEDEEENNGPKMTCVVFDVDDALSVLIDIGSTEILYDAGYAENGNYVVKRTAEYIDGELDYLIVSHSHADHCGGVPAVLDAYDVGTIITSGEKTGSSKQFDAAMSSINKEGCEVIADDNLTFDLGNDAVLNIIEGLDPKDTSEPNDLSVCAFVKYNNDGILITGDNEVAGEKALKGKLKDENITVYVAGHHMSSTSNNITLLREWNPSYIFASAAGSKESEYGFPHKEAIERCLSITNNVYATYQYGDIICIIDNGEVKLNVGSEEALGHSVKN